MEIFNLIERKTLFKMKKNKIDSWAGNQDHKESNQIKENENTDQKNEFLSHLK